MIICQMNKIGKMFGANRIFENVSFEVKDGEKVGLIGRNGTGKTTILKIIMNEESCEGSLFLKKGIRVEYLEQIPEYPEDNTVMDVLQMAFGSLFVMKNEMEDVEQSMESGEGDIDRLLSLYGRLQNEFETNGGYEMEERISKITVGLNIDAVMQEKKFNLLSGGEKTKVILGKILLGRADLLLLDEPSNHLDLKAIEWLEDYLKSYQGAVLMVSHDRYFLNRTVDRIVELDGDGASVYHGNYDYYIVEKEKRFIEKMAFYSQQNKKIKRMEEQIHRYRVWGAMRDSEKMYKKAKEMEKRLDKIDRLDKPILNDKGIRLGDRELSRAGREVVVIKDVAFGYQHNELLFEDISRVVFLRDRLCIIGGNGVGKTTLLKIIMNEIQSFKGSVKLGSKVKTGYLGQEISFPDLEKTVLETFQRHFNIREIEARNELAKVLFIRDDVHKKVAVLSGGEKSRLMLSMLLYDKANLLILDEPTNHLDLDSRQVLEQTLKEYTGTIIFVSHDRYFINEIADHICEMEQKGLNCYNGDYEYYKKEKQKADAAMIKIDAVPIKKAIVKAPKTGKVNDDKARNREIEGIINRIDELEVKISMLDMEMEKHGTDLDKLNEIYKEKQKMKIKSEDLIERWDELNGVDA